MIRASVTFLILATHLLVCGDSDSGGSGGAGDGDDDGGNGATANSSTGSPASGSTADSGASSSSGSMPDDRLYPLEIGRTWTYQVTSTYPSCPSGMRTTEATGETVVDGKTAFTVTGICGFDTAITVAGNIVESKYESYPWFRMLDEPVEEGHTWTTTNGAATFDMSYSFVGDVTTPAGTFTGCWKVTQEVSYTQDWTYCPGVGNVASTMVDLSGGTISYELTAKNF